MFAVIKTGGKQYRVAANDVLRIEKLTGEAGDFVEFDQILVIGEGAGAEIGAPFVKGAMVTAEILSQFRDAKVISFKKRRRQNSKRTRGHRQMLTSVKIAEILTGGAKPSKRAAVKPAKADPKPEPVVAKAKPQAEPAELASEPKAAKKPAKAPAKEIADDITLISGVGPALKKKLEADGITSLKQIAALDAAAIARLDEELKPAGRVSREDWVGQASDLLAGKPPRAKVDQKANKESK